ncbi:WD repeat-containing protein 60 [Phytophthora pseudosyringae]|uniref:WD repeat-containing protein 60 n=1 Tax=Phytophthora pseudosyringae TaxID=221518 RepID=A0A8T1VNA0_9STRA|nr:WD repeat-containing protein 60 [Phytophthora pseudosyringae]
MSEPKGPPALGDAAPAKKSSKKSSTRHSVAAPASQPGAQAPVAASAPPAGAVPTVPRIALAEPKPDADTKRKPSKKRTSATSRGGDANGPSSRESTPPGPTVPSGPDAVSAADASAAAKQKEDAEREKQARREAKKQRTKEIEEAKRREELAKQALEEARRLEDQKQREARQKQQAEALNANAEECQEEADDYDDDGFENYDEDFEQDEASQAKSTPLRAVGAKASSKSRGGGTGAAADEAELRRIQQAMQAETKGLHATSSGPPGSSEASAPGTKLSSRGEERSDAARPSSSIASSIAGLKQSLDPRAKRAREILERRKFEVDKFSLFQRNPVSEQDKVLSRLRRGLVKQAFVQTSDGARSLGTQTKAPETHEKSMHFPDDIGIDTDSTSTGKNGDNNEDGGASSSSTARFFKFLEHAAYVCETLAVENVMASEREAQGNQDEIATKSGEDEGKESDDKASRKRYQLTRASKLDKKLVFPSKKIDSMGSLERILQGRDLVALRFSPAVSSTLLSCYGTARRVDDTADNQQQEPSQLLRDKTISCVWDVNLPNRPLHLLKSEGVASTACLSPSRDLFVVVGTEEGSIHVWDLRPQSMIQASSLLVDCQAVCTPAYSTCGINYRAPEQHTSAIVALEAIDRGKGSSDSGGSFQFGSMDDRGVLIIWSLIEFDSGDEALITDKCVQIGGNVKIVMNTRIDMQQQYLTPHTAPKPVRRQGSNASVLPLSPAPVGAPSVAHVGPAVAVLKYFPHDPNQYDTHAAFVVGTRTGQLVKGNRFAKVSSRMQYQRGQGLKTTDASAGVVCIDFHPFEPDYFLVGYEDGSICLYHSDVSLCLTSWEEVSFGVSVCAVAWSTSRSGVFYASFSNASVLVWDLLECTSGPTLSHELDALKDTSPVELASSLYPLVISSEKMRTSRPAIAFRIDAAVSLFQFSIYELGPEFTARTSTEQQTVSKVLTYIL